MYAIAVADLLTGSLSLVRDPFGVKPLYIRRYGNGALAFASEVRTLLTPGHGVDIPTETIASFLHLGAVGDDVLAATDIEALPPNTILTVNEDGVERREPILSSATDGSNHGPAQTLDEAVISSVAEQLRADVPTALLLSAGVDSAAIASVGQRLGHSLACVTVAGLGEQDESIEASKTAAHYGHEHAIVRALPDADGIQRFFAAMQRPSIDGLNVFLVSRAIRDAGFKVALSGLGGDEALGGYAHYRLLPALPLLRAWDRLPNPAREVVTQVAGRRLPSGKAQRILGSDGPRSPGALSLLQRELFPAPVIERLTGRRPTDPVLNGRFDLRGRRRFAEMVQAESAIYMQRTLLPDADAFSMAASLELRVPFVDVPVFAAAVREARGRDWRGGKMRLARALHDDYLADLVRRPKRGFSLPMARWIDAGPLRAVVDTMRDPGAPVWDFVDRDEALAVMAHSPSERWAVTWAFASLNGWLASIADPALPTLSPP